MELYDLYFQKINNCGDWWHSAHLINHEILHIFKLYHAFEHWNRCEGIDIDCAAECNAGGLCTSGCDSWSGPTTNIMSYTGNPRNLSCCQFKRAYEYLVEKRFSKEWIDFCGEPNYDAPIVIQNGSDVQWNTARAYNRDIIIEGGAKLTITCDVIMGADKYIYVENGGFLFVDGGRLDQLCEERWGGIRVKGMHGIQVVDEDMLTPEDNGIVRLYDSWIHGAKTAVSTTYDAYYVDGNLTFSGGGLIQCERTSFENNRRAIEFLKHNHPNLSYFIDSDFSVVGETINNSVGVTIWDCLGIEFRRNEFSNFELEGILGIDYAANIVDQNIFRNCRSGIGDYSIAGDLKSLQIGDSYSPPNYFLSNEIHINLQSSDLTKVENNNFSRGRYGVLINGKSWGYEIKNNSFMNQTVISARISDTGIGYNLIRCNEFSNNGHSLFLGDIWALYNNYGTQILGNIFHTSSTVSNIYLTGSANNPGVLRTIQGDFFVEAGNCFSSTNAFDIRTNGDTEHFLYSVIPGDMSCTLPDVSGQNYSLFYNPVFDHYCAEPLALSNGGMQRLSILAESIESRGKNLQQKSSIELANLMNDIKERNILEIDLIREAVANKDIRDLERIVGSSGGKDHRDLIGYAIEVDEYEIARELIENLSFSGEEGSFRFIQTIYLDFIADVANYSLSEADENKLISIAKTQTNISANARAILALLTNIRLDFDSDFPKSMKIRERNRAEGEGNLSSFRILPNPANHTLNIVNDTELRNLVAHIYDMTGKHCKEVKLDYQHKIDISLFNSGVYVVQIVDGGHQVIETRRIVKL